MDWNDTIRRICEFLLSGLLTFTHPQLTTASGTGPDEGAKRAEEYRIRSSERSPTISRTRTSSTHGWHQDPEVSFYGPGFYGNRTACGLAYTRTILGVAHRGLPCGTRVEFRFKGITIEVPVIDRGPYISGRTWDLSGGLCQALRHCFTGPIEWRLIGGG